MPGAGSVVKSTHCSCRRHGFGSQHLHWSSCPLFPAPGSSDASGIHWHLHSCAHGHTKTQDTHRPRHTIKNKIIKIYVLLKCFKKKISKQVLYTRKRLYENSQLDSMEVGSSWEIWATCDWNNVSFSRALVTVLPSGLPGCFPLGEKVPLDRVWN